MPRVHDAGVRRGIAGLSSIKRGSYKRIKPKEFYWPDLPVESGADANTNDSKRSDNEEENTDADGIMEIEVASGDRMDISDEKKQKQHNQKQEQPIIVSPSTASENGENVDATDGVCIIANKETHTLTSGSINNNFSNGKPTTTTESSLLPLRVGKGSSRRRKKKHTKSGNVTTPATSTYSMLSSLALNDKPIIQQFVNNSPCEADNENTNTKNKDTDKQQQQHQQEQSHQTATAANNSLTSDTASPTAATLTTITNPWNADTLDSNSNTPFTISTTNPSCPTVMDITTTAPDSIVTAENKKEPSTTNMNTDNDNSSNAKDTEGTIELNMTTGSSPIHEMKIPNGDHKQPALETLLPNCKPGSAAAISTSTPTTPTRTDGTKKKKSPDDNNKKTSPDGRQKQTSRKTRIHDDSSRTSQSPIQQKLQREQQQNEELEKATEHTQQKEEQMQTQEQLKQYYQMQLQQQVEQQQQQQPQQQQQKQQQQQQKQQQPVQLQPEQQVREHELQQNLDQYLQLQLQQQRQQQQQPGRQQGQRQQPSEQHQPEHKQRQEQELQQHLLQLQQEMQRHKQQQQTIHQQPEQQNHGQELRKQLEQQQLEQKQRQEQELYQHLLQLQQEMQRHNQQQQKMHQQPEQQKQEQELQKQLENQSYLQLQQRIQQKNEQPPVLQQNREQEFQRELEQHLQQQQTQQEIRQLLQQQQRRQPEEQREFQQQLEWQLQLQLQQIMLHNKQNQQPTQHQSTQQQRAMKEQFALQKMLAFMQQQGGSQQHTPEQYAAINQLLPIFEQQQQQHQQKLQREENHDTNNNNNSTPFADSNVMANNNNANGTNASTAPVKSRTDDIVTMDSIDTIDNVKIKNCNGIGFNTADKTSTSLKDDCASLTGTAPGKVNGTANNSVVLATGNNGRNARNTAATGPLSPAGSQQSRKQHQRHQKQQLLSQCDILQQQQQEKQQQCLFSKPMAEGDSISVKDGAMLNNDNMFIKKKSNEEQRRRDCEREAELEQLQIRLKALEAENAELREAAVVKQQQFDEKEKIMNDEIIMKNKNRKKKEKQQKEELLKIKQERDQLKSELEELREKFNNQLKKDQQTLQQSDVNERAYSASSNWLPSLPFFRENEQQKVGLSDQQEGNNDKTSKEETLLSWFLKKITKNKYDDRTKTGRELNENEVAREKEVIDLIHFLKIERSQLQNEVKCLHQTCREKDEYISSNIATHKNRGEAKMKHLEDSKHLGDSSLKGADANTKQSIETVSKHSTPQRSDVSKEKKSKMIEVNSSNGNSVTGEEKPNFSPLALHPGRIHHLEEMAHSKVSAHDEPPNHKGNLKERKQYTDQVLASSEYKIPELAQKVQEFESLLGEVHLAMQESNILQIDLAREKQLVLQLQQQYGPTINMESTLSEKVRLIQLKGEILQSKIQEAERLRSEILSARELMQQHQQFESLNPDVIANNISGWGHVGSLPSSPLAHSAFVLEQQKCNSNTNDASYRPTLPHTSNHDSSQSDFLKFSMKQGGSNDNPNNMHGVHEEYDQLARNTKANAKSRKKKPPPILTATGKIRRKRLHDVIPSYDLLRSDPPKKKSRKKPKLIVESPDTFG